MNVTRCHVWQEKQDKKNKWFNSSSTTFLAENIWIPSAFAKVGVNLAVKKRDKWEGGYVVKQCFETTTDDDLTNARFYREMFFPDVKEVEVSRETVYIDARKDMMNLRDLLSARTRSLPVWMLYLVTCLMLPFKLASAAGRGAYVSVVSCLNQTKEKFKLIKEISKKDL